MRVMVFVKATSDSEKGKFPPKELFEAMGKYNEELEKAGILVTCDGLQETSKALRVHFSGKERSVSKGPFTDTSEIVAGFWIWEVKSMEEAVEWVKRCPNPMLGDSDIDIRPMIEEADILKIYPDLAPQAAESPKKASANS